MFVFLCYYTILTYDHLLVDMQVRKIEVEIYAIRRIFLDRMTCNEAVSCKSMLRQQNGMSRGFIGLVDK